MPTATPSLPLNETASPATADEVAALVADAARPRTPVYPLGGQTALDWGLPPKQPGLGLSLAGLNRVIDYPARDMTITVEAGVTLAQLAETLATERQWLPIDGPRPAEATIGGLVATAWCGARRYGLGQVRDYVIGISAVDGRGMPFKGGGRVVKNVAGYDFCKLLTASNGTLGVITQVTLKIRPQPHKSALVGCTLPDWDTAERLLAALSQTETTPTAVELLAGPAWKAASPGVGQLWIGLEGTAVEVDWMVARLEAEWQSLGAPPAQALSGTLASELWEKLRDFTASPAPALIKASLKPSAVVEYVKSLLEADPQASVQAHAGSGVVLARFSDVGSADFAKHVLARLRPAALAGGGNLVVVSTAYAGDLTRQAMWGGLDAAGTWLQRVKQQFDPYGILNPGRFAI